MRDHELPLRRSLHRAGLLERSQVFELIRVEAENRPWPEWTYLHLLRLSDGTTPRELLLREAEVSTGSEISRWLEASACTRRVEVLEGQHGGFFPDPPRERAGRAPEVYFWIEYIDVHQDALGEYRDSMLNGSFPAVRDLLGRGVFHVFAAMETKEVLVQQAGMPTWNQVHLCGLYGSRPASCAMAQFDQAVRTHDLRGKEGAWTRLAEIRVKPREDLARELAELQVGGDSPP